MDEYYECSLKQVDDWKKNALNCPEILYTSFTREDLDLDVFRQAYRNVLQKHESLRTVFIEIGGNLKQKVLRGTIEEGFGLHILSDPQARYSSRSILDSVENSFKDVSKPPIYKVFVQTSRRGKSTIFIALHHIVGDARSIDILVNDLNFAYDQILSGSFKPFPGPYTQLKDYAKIKNQEADRLCSRILPYWESKLDRSQIEALINRNLLLAVSLKKRCLEQNFRNDRLQQIRGTGDNFILDQAIETIEEQLNTNHNSMIYSFSIEGQAFTSIKSLAARLNVSVFAILNSAISFTFYLTESLASTLSSVVYSDRSKEEYMDLIGHLVGSIYFNYQVYDTLSVKEVIRKNYFSFILSLKYVLYDINILSHLNLRSASQIHFNYIKTQENPYPEFNPGHEGAGSCIYPLTIKFNETNTNIYHSVTYHNSFYSTLDIDIFFNKYLQTLTRLTQNPDVFVRDLF